MLGLDYYGDKFKWFVGVCKEISSDGTKIKVRIFGIHRMDDTVDVSDGDLPEAVVLMPATAGEGSNTSGVMAIKEGDMVVGFFADGDDCQQPIVIGVVPSSSGSSSTYDTSSTEGGGDGGVDGGGGDGGGDTGGTDYGDTEDQRIRINSTTDMAYNFFRTKFENWSGNQGNPHYQAVAIMGHITAESGWSTTARNWKGEKSWGLCQWNGDRLKKLLRKPNYTSVEVQISYIFEELVTSTYKVARHKILTANSRDAAVRGWSAYIRHCGVMASGELDEHICNNGDPRPSRNCYKKNGRCKRRFGAAKSFDEHYAGNYEGSPAPVTGGAGR